MAGNEAFFSSKDAIAATLRKIGARFDRDQHVLSKALPFERYQYVTVNFPTANEDVKVSHKLDPEDARGVVYLVVRVNRPTMVYDNHNNTLDSIREGYYEGPSLETVTPATPWTRNYIVLRSTSAPVTATVLLGLTRREDVPADA